MEQVTWKRADLGDLPDVGSEIQAVMYPADSAGSLIVYARMRADVVTENAMGVQVLGPSLPTTQAIGDIPDRPNNIVGRRGIFWRPYVDGE